MEKNLVNSLLIKEPGLQIIRLTGSPVEMGLAHGRILRDDIKHLRREFLRYLARLYLWYRRPAVISYRLPLCPAVSAVYPDSPLGGDQGRSRRRRGARQLHPVHQCHG